MAKRKKKIRSPKKGSEPKKPGKGKGVARPKKPAKKPGKGKGVVHPKKPAKKISKRQRLEAAIKKRRSEAAKKGWETKRKKNPLRWGKEAIRDRKIQKKRINEEQGVLRAVEKSFEKFVVEAPKQKEKLAALEKQIGQLEERKRNIERFGTPKPKPWENKAWNAFQSFVFTRDANEADSGIRERHQQFYRWKEWVRNKYGQDFFAQWMEMIGTAWHLPRYGKFSIESFIRT